MSGYTGDRTTPPAEGRRAPAPGGLELVRQFLNTADLEAGTDRLATGAGVAAWLVEGGTGEAGHDLDETERLRLIGIREAIRELLDARGHGETAEAASSRLDEAARRSHLGVGFSADGHAQLRPARPGVDGFVARLFAEIVTAEIEGTWERLKVCRNDVCRWAFYDASRNRSGAWCTMAVCGNRLKGRAFRRRRREVRGPAPG